MSKQKLELAEQKEFRDWCSRLDEYYQNLGKPRPKKSSVAACLDRFPITNYVWYETESYDQYQ